MIVFSIVPKKVLMPNTSAHISLESDEAIWNLQRCKRIQSDEVGSHHQGYITTYNSSQKHKGQGRAGSDRRRLMLQHLRGNGNQELIKTSEEDVRNVANPDVLGCSHYQQQTCLHGRDDTNDELRPNVPTDFKISRNEGGKSTWKKEMRSI